MSFVYDNSVAMAWFFRDEATEYADRILDRLRQNGAVVPSIWPLEAANALLMGHRRRRMTDDQLAQFLALLPSLPVRIEATSLDQAAGLVFSIARGHGLTAYDAAYVELALRLGVPLATQDVRMREAAIRLGVQIIT